MRSKERAVLDRLESLERVGRTYLGVSGSYVISGSLGSALASLSGTIDSAIKHLSDIVQPLDAELSAIAALSSNGLVERTGAGTAAIRTIGVGAGTSIPTTADADVRYLGINSGSAAIETQRFTLIPGFEAGSGGAGKSLSSNANQLYYYGKAPRNWASGSLVGVTHRMVSAGSGFTWAELAICTGSFVRGGAPTVWAVGYVNMVSQLTGSGGIVVYTEVPVMKSGGILAGEDIWLLWGKLSTGSPALWSSGLNEPFNMGVNCLMTGTWQPSTFVNTNTFVTVPVSVNTALHWVFLHYP